MTRLLRRRNRRADKVARLLAELEGALQEHGRRPARPAVTVRLARR